MKSLRIGACLCIRRPVNRVVSLTVGNTIPYVFTYDGRGYEVNDRARKLPPDESNCLSTGDMARLSNTTLRTVRFYEQEGLICSMARQGGSHRKFAPSELRKLQIISDLRESGLSLQDIKTLIGLKGRCSSAQSAAGQMTENLCRRIRELQERIDTLTRVRDELVSTVETIQHCRDCHEPKFPAGCAECEVTNQPDSSRATQLLWKN
jgi:DNA-binding transcriptional MerR regulator